jgi:PKD repeat protein
MKHIFTLLFVLFSVLGSFAQTATSPTECTVKIVFVMNKSLPPSYTFKTDPQTEGVKYYWSFGDNTFSDLPSPTHTYKVGDTYPVAVKLTGPDGKFCYGVLKARFEGGSVTVSNILTGKGKVKKVASTDGCGLLITLENGTIIVPVEMIPKFEFKDGQYVELAYELLKDKPSGCTLGISAKIHKIAEIIIPTVCKIPITFEKNNTTPVSYKFKTEPQPADSKFYWYFGDGGSSTLADPSYVFKKAGSWAINLKVIDKTGKVCYGETKGTFEGETNPPLTGRGKVKKLTSTGCDLVIAIDNAILIPVKMTTDFLLKEGQYVEFTYEKFAEKVSTCQEGTDVKIITIKEIPVISACKFEIVIKPKEATPNTYFFSTVSNVEVKTWNWKFGDGTTSDQKNSEHAYEKTGTYEVSCTITTAAGCTETRVIKHTVLAAPLANCSGAISILLFDPTDNKCNGKAIVVLKDATGKDIPNVKYIWSDNRTSSTIENLCPDKTYSVQAIVEGVCQKSYSFTFLSKPIWRATNIKGQNNFTVVEPKDGVEYEWNFGDGIKLKGAEVTYNFENDGVYDVTLKAVSGSNSSEFTQQIVVLKSVTGTDIINKSELGIYPNPVREMLNINFGNPVEGTMNIEIMNIAGKRAYAQQVKSEGYNHVNINVQQLKSGIYFLRVTNGKYLITDRKFIKAD